MMRVRGVWRKLVLYVFVVGCRLVCMFSRLSIIV